MGQLPLAFEQRIRQQMADADDFLQAITTPPVCSVRLNPAKEGECRLSESSPVDWCPHGQYLAERPQFTLNPFFHAGSFYAQEASSMYLWRVMERVAEYLPEQPAVLDLCAAPGGKSTLLSSFMAGRGVLVSNEIVRQRAWILRENIAKWGATNSIVSNLPPRAMGELGPMFDLVVIDAPCSGEGMFRKDAVAISEWTPDNADMCARRQREIWDDVWPAVVEGGIVIYSTCTFNPDENERNMQWVADEYDVEFISVEPSEGVTVIPFDGGEGYAFYPHKARGEGFFICAMRKLSGRSHKTDKRQQRLVRQPSSPMLVDADSYAVYQMGDTLTALPLHSEALMRRLSEALSPLWCGVPLGRPSRKELVPAEELPLSQAFNPKALNVVSLTEREALSYLRGEWIASCPAHQGWSAVEHGGAHLGLIKVVGGRVNNYYPKEWRIRMQIE